MTPLDTKLLRFYGQLSAALLGKFIFVLGSAFIGYKLDKRWCTFPWLSVLLVCTSTTAGIVFILKTASRIEKVQKADSEQSNTESIDCN